MDHKNNTKNELIIYLIIVILLIALSICNNTIWKFGKQLDNHTTENNITNLNSDNIIYNVPFEEEWLE